MRAYITIHGYSVAVSGDDVRAFAHQYPSSGLLDLRGVTFVFDPNGDLVDIHYRNGNAERWDGPALVTLSEDAQFYAETRSAFRACGTLKRRFTDRRGQPTLSWPGARSRVENEGLA